MLLVELLNAYVMATDSSVPDSEVTDFVRSTVVPALHTTAPTYAAAASLTTDSALASALRTLASATTSLAEQLAGTSDRNQIAGLIENGAFVDVDETVRATCVSIWLP